MCKETSAHVDAPTPTTEDEVSGGHDGVNVSKRRRPTPEAESSSSASEGGSSAVVAVAGRDEFHWKYDDEPHASRRELILAKYPQIKSLFGHDPFMRYPTTLLIVVQLLGSTVAPHTQNWWQFLLLTYLVGGTCNQMLTLALHELSHNLGFKSPRHNRIFGLIANMPLGVPAFVTFKRYHMDHHRYQGLDGVDMDIPTATESKFFRGSTVRKLAFVSCQIFFYAVRPVLVYPKKPGLWEVINALTCIVFDLTIFLVNGPWGLAYLLLGTVLGAGLHPLAGHYISEHYIFDKYKKGKDGTFETFSYYGPLNLLAYNVGYHNEHHDFPYVAGSKLPEIRRIASEFYDDLPQCRSWVGVIWDYVTDPNVGGYSRVKRGKDAVANPPVVSSSEAESATGTDAKDDDDAATTPATSSGGKRKEE